MTALVHVQGSVPINTCIPLMRIRPSERTDIEFNKQVPENQSPVSVADSLSAAGLPAYAVKFALEDQ